MRKILDSKTRTSIMSFSLRARKKELQGNEFP